MEITLTPVDPVDYPALVVLWESSVRATHHFLAPADIEFYKEIIPEYFSLVELTVARDRHGRIAAFLGTQDANIEMLFVHPDFRGVGIGRSLVRYAIEMQMCNRVDVNEQNEQAVGFYYYMDFHAVGRSEVDSMGKPYPILHLSL